MTNPAPATPEAPSASEPAVPPERLLHALLSSAGLRIPGEVSAPATADPKRRVRRPRTPSRTR